MLDGSKEMEGRSSVKLSHLLSLKSPALVSHLVLNFFTLLQLWKNFQPKDFEVFCEKQLSCLPGSRPTPPPSPQC